MKRGQLNTIIIGAVVLVAWVVVMSLSRWGWAWTGMVGHTLTEQAGTQVTVPGKTLWDWLELLIVPMVLALGAFFFSRKEKLAEQGIAKDRQQESALQAYYDRMSDFLLNENLRDAQEGDEIITIARAITLATLSSLDGQRKQYLINFLYEAKLILVKSPAINLKGANLSDANLSGAELIGANLPNVFIHNAILSNSKLIDANLSEAFCLGANLQEAILTNADLSGAYLLGANLSKANLSGVNLRGAVLVGATGTTWAQLARVKTLHGAILMDRNYYDPTVHSEIARLRKEAGLDDGNTPPEDI